MGHGAPASRRAAPLSTAPVPHNAIFGGYCAGVVQRRFRTTRANSSDHWKMAVPEFLFVAIPAQKRVEIALCGKRCATQCDFDHKLTWCGTIPRCRTADMPAIDKRVPGDAPGTPICGQGEIRTRGGLHHNGFQDRLFRPLRHLSLCAPRSAQDSIIHPARMFSAAGCGRRRSDQASRLVGSMTSLPPM